jgi:biotin carboxylase
MGETTTRYFRDKLAMRMQAAEAGIPVPEFVHVLNHARVARYMEATPAPWVLKPRFLAGAIGIKKVHTAEQAWPLIHALGDEQSGYVLERYIPGGIFHVDSIVYQSEIRFAIASAYGKPPLDVSHGGGIFTTRTLERGSETGLALLDTNARVLRAMGLQHGVSHTEFIHGRRDGATWFLETSARVGGAHIAEMLEAATGINFWAEWAKVEIAGGKAPYSPPLPRGDSAGLLVSLARQKEPDTSAYDDPEVVWRLRKDHHVGLIVRSPHPARVVDLLAAYTERVARDFHAALPPRERPVD